MNILALLMDALACLVMLSGLSVGIFALVKKHLLAGILTIAGFVLLGVARLVNYFFYLIPLPSGRFGDLLGTSTAPGALIQMLGIFAIIVGIFALVGRKAGEENEALLPPRPG